MWSIWRKLIVVPWYQNTNYEASPDLRYARRNWGERMATKKTPSSKSKPKLKPAATTPGKLQNLAARPPVDETLDEQLVDHSGVFRVTSALQQAQTGHDDDTSMRFPSESLVMAAQRDAFREDGPTIDEAVEDHLVDDETTRAEHRQRLATVAARARQLRPRR